jgi:acetyl-CoA synthetase
MVATDGELMRRLLRDLVATGRVQGDINGLEDVSTVEVIQSAMRHKL